MEKPSSIRYREFLDNIISAINNSGLPAFVMIPAVQNVLSELQTLSAQQFKEDTIAWNKQQEELTKETEESA